MCVFKTRLWGVYTPQLQRCVNMMCGSAESCMYTSRPILMMFVFGAVPNADWASYRAVNVPNAQLEVARAQSMAPFACFCHELMAPFACYATPLLKLLMTRSTSQLMALLTAWTATCFSRYAHQMGQGPSREVYGTHEACLLCTTPI